MGRSSSRSFVFLFLPEERFLFFQMEKFFHSSNFRKMENDKNRSKRWTEIFQRPGYYGINSCCSKKYEITYCSKFASSIASTDSLYANWRILFNKQTESREEWNRVVTMRFHEETSVSKKAVTKRLIQQRRSKDARKRIARRSECSPRLPRARGCLETGALLVATR